MTEARLQETLEAVLQIAETAERRFAPIRDQARGGSISAVAFHEKLADQTEALMLKLDEIHSRRIAPRIWADQAAEIRRTFEEARRIITAASLSA